MTQKVFFARIDVFMKVCIKWKQERYFIDLGKKKNYSKGKEQTFDSSNLDSDE